MKNLLFGDTPHSNKDLHADVNDEKCKPLMYTRKNRKSYSSLDTKTVYKKAAQ